MASTPLFANHEAAVNMLLVKKTEKTKNILRMPERCRILIPVSKANQGNKKILKQRSGVRMENGPPVD
jgi:hypothetical protein